MSTIALPVAFQPQSCLLRLQTNQRVNASPFGGSEQAVDMLNDRWLMDIELPESSQAYGAQVEAFIAAMRGQTNVCALYHFARTVPNGTASTVASTWTVSNASQGASSITITASAAQSGKTLLAGDLLSVGAQLLMVSATCTANGSGVMVVTLVNRLRTAISGSPYAVLASPTQLFRLLSAGNVTYERARASGVSLQFGEYIA